MHGSTPPGRIRGAAHGGPTMAYSPDQMIQARSALLSYGDISPYERQLLTGASLTVDLADDMGRDAMPSHYLSAGLSAMEAIAACLQAAGNPPADPILDFPCGFGRVGRFMRVRWPTARIVGVDVQPKALEFVSHAFGYEALLSGPFATLALPGPFSLIWCGSLATHLPRPDVAELLRLFRRHLTPGGLLVLTTHGERSVAWIEGGRTAYGLSTAAERKILVDYRASGYGYADYPRRSGYGISVASPWVMRHMAIEAGLREVAFRAAGWDSHQDVWGWAVG